MNKTLSSDESKTGWTSAFNVVSDGLENLVAGLGGNQAKRPHSRFKKRGHLATEASHEIFNALYREDGIAAKAVDIIPDDMCREWRRFTKDVEPDHVDLIEEEEKRLQLQFKINLALKWAGLYGTSYLALAIDDGKAPTQAVDWDNIIELRHVNVFDRTQVTHGNVPIVRDPMDPNFGMPEFYRFNDSSILVHHSRIIRFEGKKLPYREFEENNYVSDSVLAGLYDALMNFSTVSDAACEMVFGANVDVIQVEGLMNKLQTKQGEETLNKRFSLAARLKSFVNLMLLDSKETYSKHSNTFAGLPDLYDRYIQTIATIVDAPISRFAGVSAGGMSATGEGDEKNYFANIKAKQKLILAPVLNYIDLIIASANGIDSKSLSYEFNSLFSQTPTEKSTAELQDAQRDQLYYDMGIISEEIIAKDLRQKGVYDNLDDDHIEELEKGFDEEEFNKTLGNAERNKPKSETKTEESGSNSDPQVPGS